MNKKEIHLRNQSLMDLKSNQTKQIGPPQKKPKKSDGPQPTQKQTMGSQMAHLRNKPDGSKFNPNVTFGPPQQQKPDGSETRHNLNTGVLPWI
jgi:hypothetical protein